RYEDLMVAGQAVAPAVAGDGTLHDVDSRPIRLDEVEVRGGEALHRMAEVARERQRLQEHLGQHDRRADVQVDAASAEPRDLRGEQAEVEVGGAAERRG